jgi:hypothetical protein
MDVGGHYLSDFHRESPCSRPERRQRLRSSSDFGLKELLRASGLSRCDARSAVPFFANGTNSRAEWSQPFGRAAMQIRWNRRLRSRLHEYPLANWTWGA